MIAESPYWGKGPARLLFLMHKDAAGSGCMAAGFSPVVQVSGHRRLVA